MEPLTTNVSGDSEVVTIPKNAFLPLTIKLSIYAVLSFDLKFTQPFVSQNLQVVQPYQELFGVQEISPKLQGLVCPWLKQVVDLL